MAARLELRHVVRVRRDAEREFSVDVEGFALTARSLAAVIGPSGSGKSTLLDVLGLALAPTAAERFAIRTPAGDVDLQALWSTGAHERLAALRRHRFGYVLQGGGLLPFLSVEENIALPMRLAARLDDARLAHLLARLELDTLRRAGVGDLSFGQRQRAAVARALAHGPDFVLADEPTAALDPRTARRVMGLLCEICYEEGRGLVVVSHDHALLDRFPFARWHIDGQSSAGVHRSRLAAVEPDRMSLSATAAQHA